MEEELNVEKKYQVDIRNVIIIFLIIILIGVCVWFIFDPFGLSKTKELEQSILIKETQISQIQKQRDSLKSEISIVDDKILKLETLAKNRRDTIEILRKLSNFKDIEIKDLRSGMDFYNEMLKRRSQEIENLMKNPIILPKNVLVEKSREKFK